MNSSDRDLLIEIRVDTDDGGFEVSTGYPIARDLILTARHGLYPSKRRKKQPIQLRWFHQRDKLRAFVEVPRSDIAWQNKKLDVALLRCTFPEALVDWRHLSPIRPFPDERWFSEGFPKGADVPSRVEAFPVAGRAHGAASGADRVHLGLDDGFKDPPSWGGISGAPVFVRGQIVGVIVSTPSAAQARLLCTPSAALFAADGVKEALGYDRAEGRVSAARNASLACLQGSEQARIYLGKALGTARTESDELARQILDLVTPEVIVATIKAAHARATTDQEAKAAAVLRELALIALPARFDEVIVDGLRATMADPQHPVLTPAVCTPTGAEIALAAAEQQRALLKPVAPGERYPDGELNLAPPPNCGMDAEDDRFKEAWDGHLINKFANTSEVKHFSFAARARIAVRRMRNLSEDKRRTHYVLLYDEGNDADNQRWELRAGLACTDCPSLVFVRLSDDDERIEAETALLDPFCSLFTPPPETAP